MLPPLNVILAAAFLLWARIAGAQPGAITLTDAEAQWLREHPRARLGVDPAWPPFSFIGKDGTHQGINAEILALVSARTGLAFDLVPTKSWAETVALGMQQLLELTPGTAETAERAKHVNFTRPYLAAPVAVIMREDAPFWVGLHSLAGKEVAVPRNYVTTDHLSRTFPELRLVLTEAVRAQLPSEAATAQRDLEEMRLATERMSSLVGNLLSAEAIEQGERWLAAEPVAWSPIVAGVVDRQRRVAAAKEIVVERSDPVGKGARLRGDPLALEQIAENLVGNALKFTPRGGRVAVTLEADPREVRLTVADNGPGIRPEERARLFEKFARLSARPTGGESSSGLGLAIVKLLATAMHGTVRYDDAPGGGAQFTVTFPRVG